tara:strand:+ start:915 stop:2066 length:1152 start_codon:yes stop_codon:yes gene_type:complete
MNTKKKTWHSKYKDQEKLNQLTEIVLENIEDIYEYFDVQSHRGQKVYFSECFIHGGDNRSALNLYYDADYRVHYKCRTHGCEAHFGTSLLSMIRGGLSNIKYGWSVPGDKTVSFDETVEFLLDRYNLDFNGLKGQKIDAGNHEFSKLVNGLSGDKVRGNITKDFYRSKVEIPSQYYLQRGYSIEVLDDYDVGTCKTYGKPMFNRAVVPVYDEVGETIIGFTGRSIFEQCPKCKSYHDPNKDCFYFPKWRHTKGFQKEKALYNYHRAKEHIISTGVIILVESPGNIWRLEESGIHNAVGLFGTTLNPPQKQLIDESGALTVVIIMDNDDHGAGQKAAEEIKKQLERTYRVYIIDIKKNDVGEMSTNEVTDDILPWINQAKEAYL